MLVEKTKKAVGRLLQRTGSTKGAQKRQLRKLIHESLEDRRVMTAIALTSPGLAYTQNFDTLLNTGVSADIDSANVADGAAPNGNFPAGPLSGWAFTESGSGANKTYAASDGTGTNVSGNTLSLGTTGATDRAFGNLNSSSLTNPAIGAFFANNTGTTITSVGISFTGEQWRLGASGRQDKLIFEYNTSPTQGDLSAGTWTAFNSLDFNAPNTVGTAGTAFDGNLAANQVGYNQILSGLSVATGTQIAIRWRSFDASGADDMLGIDNFSLTPNPTTPGVSITASGPDTTVNEDPLAPNATDVYTIVLQTAPASNVTVNINPGTQLTVSSPSVLFTPANWSTPQTITIGAVNDSVGEWYGTGTITHTVTSTAPGYSGLSVPSLTVQIVDNDIPTTKAASLTGSPYTQNFDALGSSGTNTSDHGLLTQAALKGWFFSEDGTSPDSSYGFDDGSSNTGNTYSYGTVAAADRALGGLGSGGTFSSVGALFVNNTGAPIATINLAYAAERWRVGDAGRDYTVNFQYSTDAFSLTSGNWTDVDALDWTLPGGDTAATAVDGNAAANRATISGLIPSLNLPVGGTIWIRWHGANEAGNDDGWGVDDLTLTSNAVAAPGVTITEDGGSTTVKEGADTDTYTIVLQSQPTANVTVNISAPGGKITTAPTPSVTFTPANWSTAQTVTVTAVNNATYDGTVVSTITHTTTSTQAAYNGLSVPSVDVTVLDNDPPTAYAIPLTGADYTQDFDTLINTGVSPAIPDGLFTTGTLKGWAFYEAAGTSGDSSDNTYGASDGSSGTGNTYSFGADGDTDRAFGGVGTGSNQPSVGAIFKNNTGAAITHLDINYIGEQWRVGATGRNDILNLKYSLDASSLSDGTWTDSGYSYVAPLGTAVGAVNGNDPANRQAISGSITGLNIPAGATFWLRFDSDDVSGADDGLGVDDFKISTGAPTNTPPTITSVANQSVAGNTATGALAFTVGDAQTAPAALTVTATSSNTTLVPVANIALGGSGASRTVNVTPATGQSGVTTITLTVSDGTLTTSTTFTVTVAAIAPPTVQTIVFGDGTTQRSMVKSITVTFNTAVTIDAGAFLLQTRVGTTATTPTAAQLAINVSTALVSGKTVATLTFTGSLIIGGSLSDGNWKLTIASNKVHAGGVDLDGDGVGGAGGDYVKGAVAADAFFRLFGDFDGNRAVTPTDVARFRLANGTTSASPNYRAAFDFDSNNNVSPTDLARFRLRNGTSVPG